MKKTLSRFWTPFFLLVGTLLLVQLIRRFGTDQLYQTFQNLGWNELTVLFLPAFWYLAHTLAWYFVLEETGDHVSLWELFKIKVAGEAVNTLTPVSWMGGDPIRVHMLQKKMPGSLSAASTVVDRTMFTLSTILLLLVGLSVAWFYLEMPRAWRFLFPTLTGAIILGLWFFIHHQQKGFFDRLSRLLTRFGFKKHLTESVQEKIQVLDKRISGFYRRHPIYFVLVLSFHFLARLLGVLEIYLIARFLDIPLGAMGALFLASLTILVNLVFVFIPGSMGVLEGAYGALFSVMGLNPVTGVAIQLVRRLRTLFWVLIGLGFMLTYYKLKKPKKRESAHG